MPSGTLARKANPRSYKITTKEGDKEKTERPSLQSQTEYVNDYKDSSLLIGNPL